MWKRVDFEGCSSLVQGQGKAMEGSMEFTSGEDPGKRIEALKEKASRETPALW